MSQRDSIEVQKQLQKKLDDRRNGIVEKTPGMLAHDRRVKEAKEKAARAAAKK